MHAVFSDRIIHTLPTERGIFRFRIPVSYREDSVFDMAIYLQTQANTQILNERLPQKYSEAYPESIELAKFESLLEDALTHKKQIHVENISLKSITDRVRDLYLELGYFVPDLNAFVVDFDTAPITLGINVHHLMYSTKEIYTLGDALFQIIPPPRSPAHQKGLIAALNSGVITRIRVDSSLDEVHLATLLKNENIALIKAAGALYDHYNKIGNPMDFRLVDLYLD